VKLFQQLGGDGVLIIGGDEPIPVFPHKIIGGGRVPPFLMDLRPCQQCVRIDMQIRTHKAVSI